MNATKKGLIEEALCLYDKHSIHFQKALTENKKLYEERKKKGIRPLNRLPKELVEELPKNIFLESSREEAEKFLDGLSVEGVKKLINHINYVTEYDVAYNAVLRSNEEYKREIKLYDSGYRKGKGKPLAMAPEYISLPYRIRFPRHVPSDD